MKFAQWYADCNLHFSDEVAHAVYQLGVHNVDSSLDVHDVPLTAGGREKHRLFTSVFLLPANAPNKYERQSVNSPVSHRDSHGLKPRKSSKEVMSPCHREENAHIRGLRADQSRSQVPKSSEMKSNSKALRACRNCLEPSYCKVCLEV